MPVLDICDLSYHSFCYFTAGTQRWGFWTACCIYGLHIIYTHKYCCTDHFTSTHSTHECALLLYRYVLRVLCACIHMRMCCESIAVGGCAELIILIMMMMMMMIVGVDMS